MNQALNLLPQAVDVEQSAIGAMLTSDSAVDDILDILIESDFIRLDHQRIFSSIKALSEANVGIDILTVSDLLSKKFKGDESISIGALSSMAKNTPYSGHATQYAKTIKDKSRLRSVIYEAEKIIEEAYKGELSTDIIVDRMASAGELISQDTIDDNKSISTVMSATMDELERRVENKGNIIGLKTGIKELDEDLSGLQKGKLYVVGGRPAMGKSTLVFNWAETAALAGATVQVFTLEMTDEECGMKFLSSVGRVDHANIQSAKMSSSEWSQATAAAMTIQDKKLFLDDTTSLSMAQIKARSRKIKNNHGLDLVIIDYLQLMETDNSNNHVQDISRITRGMKNMAKELDCAVVLLSQLNRECEKSPNNKRPNNSHLRDSGSIEQDANVIIMVYRHEIYFEGQDEGIAELLITKNRGGKTGTVRARFVGQHQRFEGFA